MRQLGHRQAGFTLAEVLLTLGVISILLISLTFILQDLSREEVDISTASHMDQIGQAVEDMLMDFSQFRTLHEFVTASAGGVVEIPVEEIIDDDGDGRVGVVVDADGNFLQPTNVLPSDFEFRSPTRLTYSLIFFLSNGGASDEILGLSYLLLSNERVATEAARKITQNIGSQSGYYNRDYNVDGVADTPLVIGSAFGAWNVPLASVTGTSWHTTATASAGLPDATNGWYLAYYGFINQDHAAQDYLYRVAQPGFPELHTLHGDLNMANQNIIGVDNAFIDDLIVTENVIARGSALLQSQDASNNFTISDSLIHDSRAQISQISAGTFGVARNLYITESMLTNNPTNIGNESGGFGSGRVDVQTMAITGSVGDTALEISERLSVGGSRLSVDGASIESLVGQGNAITVGRNMSSLSNLTIDTLNIIDRDLAVFDMFVEESLSGGTAVLNIDTNTSVPRLRAGEPSGVKGVTINSLRDCISGCDPDP